MNTKLKVAIIGAGVISYAHAKMINTLSDVALTSIVDSNLTRAQALARQFNIENVYTSTSELLKNLEFDAAHVCVPPHIHYLIANELLDAGKHIFVEKPLGITNEQCEQLVQLAEKKQVTLGVNQNWLFDKTFRRLSSILDVSKYGAIQHLNFIWNVPLPPLTDGQHDMWMFEEPGNIILEQAVHPLSCIQEILGPISKVTADVSNPEILHSGQTFYQKWLIFLHTARSSATLHMAFGQPFPVISADIICNDAHIQADLIRGRISIDSRTSYPRQFDSLYRGIRSDFSTFNDTLSEFGGSVKLALKLTQLTTTEEAFQQSIENFYNTITRDQSKPTGKFGQDLVKLCLDIIHSANVNTLPPIKEKRIQKKTSTNISEQHDIAIFGASGFIGQSLLRLCLDKGLSVRALTRNRHSLAAYEPIESLQILEGDAEDPEIIDQMTRGVTNVVDLVFLKDDAGSVDRIANLAFKIGQSCLDNNVEKLIYTSSIAALYLGNPDLIVETTSTDEHHQRNEYCRGKALAEKKLLDLHKHAQLSVCILRPGVVIGNGGPRLPFAVGKYPRAAGVYSTNDQHCIGWRTENAKLPFVLVEDVAEAIDLAINTPESDGQIYNLVGDIDFTAEEYVEELARVLGRPLIYHPRSILHHQFNELSKWAMKKLFGQTVPFPFLRELSSQRMVATFNTSITKSELGWKPEQDRQQFIQKGIAIHGKKGTSGF